MEQRTFRLPEDEIDPDEYRRLEEALHAPLPPIVPAKPQEPEITSPEDQTPAA